MSFLDQLRSLLEKAKSAIGLGPRGDDPAQAYGAMKEHVECCKHGESLEPAKELVIARHALQTGDPIHALYHAASALAQDPRMPEALAVLDAIFASVDKRGIDLEKRLYGNGVWFGEAACIARWLARRGRHAEALGVISQAQEQRPDSEFYWAWAPEWLEVANRNRALPIDDLIGTLIRAFKIAPEFEDTDDQRRAALARLYAAAPQLHASNKLEGMRAFMQGVFLRKTGHVNEAVEVARRYEAATQEKFSAVALARVLMVAGQPEESIKWYEKAFERDPADGAPLLDIGDHWIEVRDYVKARDAYSRALKVEPMNEWAVPGIEYCNWRLGDAEAFQRLRTMASGSQYADRASQLLETRKPYVGFLPAPDDATANILRQLVENESKALDQGQLTVTTSAPEAPSVVLPFEVEGQRYQASCEINLVVGQVFEPDPRKALPGATSLLWRFEGDSGVRIPGPPGEKVAESVAQLSAAPYYDEECWNRAAAAAEILGDAALGDLLAVMVHPPPAPDNVESPLWVLRVQVEVATVIAALTRGWKAGPARETLTNLLRGPVDWSVTAAIVALRHIAVRNPGARQEVVGLFEEQLARIPSNGYTCYYHALLLNWLLIPDRSKSESDRLVAQWKQLIAD